MNDAKKGERMPVSFEKNMCSSSASFSLHCQFPFVMCELFAVYQRASTLLPGTRRA